MNFKWLVMGVIIGIALYLAKKVKPRSLFCHAIGLIHVKRMVMPRILDLAECYQKPSEPCLILIMSFVLQFWDFGTLFLWYSRSGMIGSNRFHMLSIPLLMLYLSGSSDLIVVTSFVRDILSISIFFCSYLNKSEFSLVLYATSCQSISILWKRLKMHDGPH